MEYLVFLGGVVLGTVVTLVFQHFRTALGYFKVEPYDEDDTGYYKVNICIVDKTNLLYTDRIILRKEKSQK